LVIKATQEQISGTKSILNMDRDIEFTPPQIPPNETLTITIDAIDDLSGSPDQPIELLSKDFIYQGESLLLVHDHGPPKVERIVYEGNSLYIDFNERIDPASVTDNVEIEYGSNIINGSIEVTGDNQVKFTPSANLSSNVDYVIRVKDIKDAASKTIEVFTYNFELNQQESLIFNLSILAKNNHSIVGNNSLMHGRTFEPEIGLYFYRARYLHPELGRFLQTDPLGYEDSMNLYQAFNQNPVNFVDPMGELIKAEYGKHDVLKTAEFKTGKWWLDYTIIGAFNELRNAAALGINLGTNLKGIGGEVTDKGLDVVDLAAREVGISENEGEFKEFLNFAFLYFGANSNASETRHILSKVKSILRDTKSWFGKMFGIMKKLNLGSESGHIGYNVAKNEIVLGQNMPKRVIPAAEKLNAGWFDIAESEWTWKENLKFLMENIRKVKKSKGRIFDVGWQKGRYHGPYAVYTREKQVLLKAGLKRVFTGKWITTSNGKRFRLYEWVPK
jgi:RHS repeat-associated protein